MITYFQSEDKQDFYDDSFASSRDMLALRHGETRVDHPDGTHDWVLAHQKWLKGCATGAVALTSYLSNEAREHVTHLSIGGSLAFHKLP